MDSILNLETFNIDNFDQIVSMALSSTASPNKKAAEDTIMKFKQLPNSWTKVDFILKQSKNDQSKLIALQILEDNVKIRWNLFDENIKGGLRQYVFTAIKEHSELSASVLLSKLNDVLIEIVKRDWPVKWPSFIEDLINVSQSSMRVSTNTLYIFKRLNESVFLINDDISTARCRILKNQLNKEYLSIFNFISLILEYSQKQELDDKLLENCLYAFKSYCRSMPSEYVFSTKIVEFIVEHLNSAHSVATLDCLLEIAELKKSADQGYQHPDTILAERKKITYIHEKLCAFFHMYAEKFDHSLKKITQLYPRMEKEEQYFVEKFAMTFSSIYSLWTFDLPVDNVKIGMKYFIALTRIDNSNLFRSIFPTWSKIIYELYAEYPGHGTPPHQLRRSNFVSTLESLLPVLVKKMPRPEEVFILVNEMGEIIRDKNVNSDDINFYKSMKTNFFYLCFVIEEHMKDYFDSRMSQLQDSTQFDYHTLNQMCWSIGSLSDAMLEDVEKSFFIEIIKKLLVMCERYSKKEDKAVIASNIMYIIGQYQRFLKNNLAFLSVVVNKLIEFMSESFEGIKEMACDNFLKICEKCSNQFFSHHRDGGSIMSSVLNSLGIISLHLDFYHQRIVIEGIFSVIKNNSRVDPHYIDRVLSELTEQSLINYNYINTLHTIIHNQPQFKALMHLIECYKLAYQELPSFSARFNVLEPMLLIYKKFSDVHVYPENVSDMAKKNMRFVKSNISNFFEVVVNCTVCDEVLLDKVRDTILDDFKTFQDPSILSLAAAISKKSNTNSSVHIERQLFIIRELINSTLRVITSADDFPELSEKYLNLLKVMFESSFVPCMSFLLDSAMLPKIMESIHSSLPSLKDVSTLAIEVLFVMYQMSFEAQMYTFFNRYYQNTLENLLGIIFDRDMKHNYEQQILFLYQLINYLPNIPLFNANTPNEVLISEFLGNLIGQTFNNLTQSSIQLFISGLFKVKNKEAFKEHIDDFGIKMYEFGNDVDLAIEGEILEERVRLV